MTTLPPGTHVHVHDDWPETRGAAHIRTPHYLRGRTGTVLRALGTFPNPEALAFARPAEPRALYHVAFPSRSLWPDAHAGDDVVAELYEHWLEVTP